MSIKTTGNKTILITGSTDGVGKLLAKKFAVEGHHLWIHGRNQAKVSQTVEEIKRESHNPNIIGFVADFSDIDQVHSMAKDIKKLGINPEIIVNNAGVFHSEEMTNIAGLDIRVLVNFLSPYLLTHLMLPLLKKNTAARILNVSSAAQAVIDLDFLAGENTKSPSTAYAQSKFALTAWSIELAKQHPEMTVIAVNPGSLLHTKMALTAYGQSWSSAEKGADILYQLALDDKYRAYSGQYFDNDTGQFSQAHPAIYQPSTIANLLTRTHEILKLNDHF